MKESLYKRIARELAQQVAVGTFVPGSLFSTEMELCETWQVSRRTMREALRELTEQGPISRRKGAGIRIYEPKANDVSHPLSYLEDLLLLAKSNLRVIKKVDEIMADIELPRMTSCPPGSRWLHIASTREDIQNPDVLIYWTDNHVSTDYARLRTYIRDDPHSLISGLVETHHGIKSHEVHQTIMAVDVPKKVTEILNVTPDSPAVRVMRRYLDRDRKVLEATISIHPAGRYICSIVLKLQGSEG